MLYVQCDFSLRFQCYIVRVAGWPGSSPSPGALSNLAEILKIISYHALLAARPGELSSTAPNSVPAS